MEKSNSLHELHQRYLLQTKWTLENRHRLYSLARLDSASRVLEVGSGTGAITHELNAIHSVSAYGIDIDPQVVAFAHAIDKPSQYVIGDGGTLPYPDGCFDISLCHFLLLWVRKPLQVLTQMRRVTKPEGAILALAEPDYGGRIDYPEDLELVGDLQAEGLRRQGADPLMGRKLRMLFTEVDLENIHVGVLGGQWHGIPDEMTIDSEIQALIRDVAGYVTDLELDEFISANQVAWSRGHRLLFVPTFYACGWKPA